MHDLPYYKEQDQEVINEFLAKYPFAFLTGCDYDSRPTATQVPVFV